VSTQDGGDFESERNYQILRPYKMSEERFLSEALALLLSLHFKFVFSRKILIMRVLEMCLFTFYTTHTNFSPNLSNRFKIDYNLHLGDGENQSYMTVMFGLSRFSLVTACNSQRAESVSVTHNNYRKMLPQIPKCSSKCPFCPILIKNGEC
jgi:hypothetical protein